VLIPRLVNVLGSDQWSEDVVPTVAFNLRQVRKGNVTMKVWDVAVCLSLSTINGILHDTQELINQGQPKFRGMWDRYCRGADAILYVTHTDLVYQLTNRYVVDAADVSFSHLFVTAQADWLDKIPSYCYIRITCSPWSTLLTIRPVTCVSE